MDTPKNHAADYAIELARSLEARLGPETDGELDMLDDVLELTADTTGRLTVPLLVDAVRVDIRCRASDDAPAVVDPLSATACTRVLRST